MKRDLQFEAFYDVPREKVWRALTDSAELRLWLMPNNFVAQVGHKFQFRDTPRGGWDGVVECQVLEVDPGQRLSYTWKSDALDTTVTWSLESQQNGTTLRLAHQGFRGIKAVVVSMMLNRGWRGTLLKKKLPTLLGAHEITVT
jgi:uncharacterized protein YndB with AHSA1/START domain